MRFRSKSDAPDLHTQLESMLDQVWRSESDWRLWDRLDAAVMLLPPDNRLSQSGTKLTALALEAAGVPVLMIDADMVDAKIWDHDRMVGLVADFLRDRRLA